VWTLQVIKFNKAGKCPEKQRKSVVSEFSSGPWVLDVDEDFFSCNNPYGDEFWDLFGMDMYSCLTEVYDLNGQNICSEKQLYNQPWRKFSKLSIIKELMENVQCDEDCVERHMRKFHKFVRKTWPKGADSQANVIHGLCEDLLKVLYESENIQRLDRPKFSVDNVPIEDQGKLKARDILDICEPEERSEQEKGSIGHVIDNTT